MKRSQNHEHTEDPIAIVGIGCRFAGGVNNPSDFWKLLIEGRDAIRDIPRQRWSKRLFYHPDKNRIGKIYAPKGGFLKDIDKFDPEFFGISPREAAYMDPQQRLLLETTWEALEDAGINPKSLAGSDTGVFVGLFMHDYETINSKPSERNLKGPHTSTGTSTTIAANRISYIYDFRGPSMVIDTACSSSLITIHLACQSLRNNESGIALAGGVNIVLNPEVNIGLCKASMLSPGGYSKAFDESADGYTRAEGTGLVVLKPLSKAIENNDQIYAVIRSSVTNQDGKSDGQTVPRQESQEAAIKEALRKAKLNPNDIQYVEAHGTGTPVGDPIEANAIGSVLSKNRDNNNPCIIGSIKTNIGHTESAAGVAGVIKLALMLKNKKIPKNLHFKKPNPKIDFNKLKLRIPTSLEEWKTNNGKPRICGINSFGFGGSNAHAILEEFTSKNVDKKKAAKKESNNKILIPLSGHTKKALKGVAKSYLDFLALDKNKNVKLKDIGYTSALRKGEHANRLTIVAETKNELIDKLKTYIEDEKCSGMTSANAGQNDLKKIAFVFSGMGQQWWKMGRELLDEEPEFRKMIQRCDKLFKKCTKEWSLLEELGKDEENSRINETKIAQPAIFALQVALYELWKSRGIIPDTIIGHSVGEVAAAYATGILSLEDAIKVSYNRSRLQHQTAGQGKMLAVGLPVVKMDEILKNYKNKVSIAAINSPNSVTIAGDDKSLEDIFEVLEKDKIFVRFLKVEVPYHSPVMDTILSELKESLKDTKPRKGNIPLMSTVTGSIIDGKKINGDYWCDNVRKPVYFNKAVDELIETGHDIFLEIGAHPVLAASVNECLVTAGKKAVVLPSLRRKESENMMLLNSLGALYCNGYKVDWSFIYKEEENLIKLPCYAWQRETYWNESDESKQERMGLNEDEAKIHPLIGEKIDAIIPTWKNEIDLLNLSYLKDHMVQGSIIYPGAAYMEMGLALAKEQFGDIPCILEDVEIKAPLLLKDNDGAQIHSMIERDNTFTIYSRNSEQKDWSNHIIGKIGTTKEKPGDRIDIKKIKEHSQNEEIKEESYKRFKSLGLEYGQHFQSISHLWMNDEEILGEIKVTKMIDKELNNYFLHPVVLDAAFQVMASMPMDATYLPVSIDQLTFFARPKGTIYSYARVMDKKASIVKGDIQILDEQGNIIAEVQGLTCQYVEGTRKNKQNSIQGNLYEYQWILDRPKEEGDIIDSSEYLVSPSYIYNKVKRSIPNLINQYDRNRFYGLVEPKIDNLCKEYFVNALRKLGSKFKKNERFTTQEMIDKLRIVKEHSRLFNRILEILEQEKILKHTNDSWQVVSEPEHKDTQKLWNEMFLEHSNHEAELMLIERCGSNLAKILTGKQDPLALIFPPGSLLTEHLYRNAPTFRIYNRLVQESISAIIDALPEGQILRILEVGAGTGSLSSYVLPVLPSNRVEYVFTDITAAFTNQAEVKFKNFSFVDYKTLNIENDPAEQGFDKHSFDLILASDAIHATKNLTNTLSNVKKLLASNGMLVLLEATKPIRWFDLVFGTLTGWWLFEDLDIRPNHVLLSDDDWISLFKKNSFQEVTGISDKQSGYTPLHNILIAKGPELERTTIKKSKINISEYDTKRPWIILMDEQGIGSRLAEQLEKKGITPIIVTKGNFFKELKATDFIIRPGLSEDIDKLLDITCKDLDFSPNVINMWNLSSSFSNNIGIESLEKITNESCIEVLQFSQALIKRNWNSPPGFKIITNGTQTVGGIKDLNLEQTPLWGFGRVLISEHSDWNTQIIDLSIHPSEEEVSLLSSTLLTESSEDEIALRDRKRYVHRLVKAKEKFSTEVPREAFSLYKSPTKTLDGFKFEQIERRKPGPLEVEIEVKAVGLNFKDILRAIGVLETNLAKNGLISNFGLEVSGIIKSVGEKVTKFKAGDEVMGIVKDGFRNYTTTDPQVLVHKPMHLSFEEAATIPVSFITVYYALKQLAKIQKGESVLIHSATGGAGIAAIQIAKRAGAKIFTTAGSPDKRALLKSMNVEYVGDSRALDFYDEIMELTNNQGVDIVLNTLPEKGMLKSLEALKPVTGRFVDLSNMHSQASLKMQIFKKGITFFAFDLERIRDTKFIGDIFQEVVNIFDDKELHPLPQRVFPISDIANAFVTMKSAKHIGKIVVSMEEPGVEAVPSVGKIDLDKNATYLFTGGLGGFGLAVAKWFAACGARNFVLLGRSGDSKPAAKKAVQELRDMGAVVFVGKVDVTKEEELKKVLSKIEETMPPLKGIIHAAMVLEDVSIDKMSSAQMIKVLNPKILGAWNLHTQTLDKDLDFFISFSSFTSLVGNIDQGNYAAGNLFIDTLSHYRNIQGLPGLTICWGAIGDVGYVAEHEEIKEHFHRQGTYELSLIQAWNTIKYGIENKIKQMGIMPVDWKKLSKYSPSIIKSARFTELLKSDTANTLVENLSENDQEKVILPDSPEERRVCLTEILTKVVGRVLGVISTKIDLDKPLQMYGLDSLMAVELNVQIKETIKIDLPKMVFLQSGINISGLVRLIEIELDKTDDNQAKESKNVTNKEEVSTDLYKECVLDENINPDQYTVTDDITKMFFLQAAQAF